MLQQVKPQMILTDSVGKIPSVPEKWFGVEWSLRENFEKEITLEYFSMSRLYPTNVGIRGFPQILY